MQAITTGNFGQTWRADVTPYGAIEPWGDTPPLNWYVAADDRWHVPADEAAVRQRRIDGTPVTETRLRVPTGDVVQRVYSTANDGGITIVEVENESTLPVAIAFDRRDVLTERSIADIAIEGIDLPAGAFVLPLGHAATLRIGLAHGGATSEGRLREVPSYQQVVRGWLTLLERAGRYVLPDGELGQSLVDRALAERADIALGGLAHPDGDATAFLLGIDQLVRLGEPADPWIDELAGAVERIGPTDGWLADAALRAALRVLLAADEARAARDLQRILGRREMSDRPTSPPDGVAVLAWIDEGLVAGSALVPDGIPEAWLGQSFETYGVPSQGSSTLSYGVRWHGERPAVLWEQHGEPVTLAAPVVDPSWSSDAVKGEALWSAPNDRHR